MLSLSLFYVFVTFLSFLSGKQTHQNTLCVLACSSLVPFCCLWQMLLHFFSCRIRLFVCVLGCVFIPKKFL